MKIKMQKLKRASYVFVAATLVSISLASGWSVQKASAAQLLSRFIKMSRSAPSATNVVYEVNFTIPASVTVGSVVIDFCHDTPIIGDACDEGNLTGFNTNDATLSINNQDGAAFTDLSVDAALSDTNTLVLTRASATSVSGTVSFELGDGTNDGITNRDSADTFFARIHTYASTAPTHNEDAATGYVDSGGVALSTAEVIDITARVMEQLTFCVYPDDNGGGAGSGTCGDPGDIEIGHDPGTGTLIIDDSQIDTVDIKFSISTNANSGAVVRLWGDTLKDAQGNDINPAGGTFSGGTPATITAGTEAFGLRVETAGTNITASTPYDGTTATAEYSLDATSTEQSDITETFGGMVADLSAPTSDSTTTIRYGATASVTTAAGTYTASHQYICTGTF